MYKYRIDVILFGRVIEGAVYDTLEEARKKRDEMDDVSMQNNFPMSAFITRVSNG